MVGCDRRHRPELAARGRRCPADLLLPGAAPCPARCPSYPCRCWQSSRRSRLDRPLSPRRSRGRSRASTPWATSPGAPRMAGAKRLSRGSNPPPRMPRIRVAARARRTRTVRSRRPIPAAPPPPNRRLLWSIARQVPREPTRRFQASKKIVSRQDDNGSGGRVASPETMPFAVSRHRTCLGHAFLGHPGIIPDRFMERR
jgi:hypothetical protein